jgi:hypothetical protein
MAHEYILSLIYQHVYKICCSSTFMQTPDAYAELDRDA